MRTATAKYMMLFKREREMHGATVLAGNFNAFSQKWITRQDISREMFELS